MKKVSLAAFTSDFLRPLACFVLLGLVVLLTVSSWHDTGKYPSDPKPSNQATSVPMPNLTGDQAKGHRNEQGMARSLSEAIQAARYSVNWVKQAPIPNQAGAFQAHNPGQGYSTYFAEDEVHLIHRSGDEKWHVMLKLTGFGDSNRIEPITKGEIKTENNRVEIRKSAIRNSKFEILEWYENKPEGLEQGFNINTSPPLNPRSPNSPLRLTLQIESELQPRLESDGQALSFVKETHGASVLNYGNLKAIDAKGKELVSRMELRGDELSLVVDDNDAVYPLTIDPLFTQKKNLTASDPTDSADFGVAVAIDGDTVVAGASGGLASQQGSAYIFERNQGGADNWAQVKELSLPAGVFGDSFGWSVAISGDLVLIGAISRQVGNHVRQGAAYIYDRNAGGANNWGLVKEITASDGETYDNFGYSVGLSGDTAIIGMANHQNQGDPINSSAAYVLERNQGGANNWGEVRIITRTDNQDDWGGFAVAISGDTAIIGAPKHVNFTTSTIGSAYVIERDAGGPNNWGIVKKLNSGLFFVNSLFGVAVAIDGDKLIVGAGQENIPGENAENAAYVFDRNSGGSNNWGQVRKVVAADDVSGNAFGLSLSISDDTAVIGARGTPNGSAVQQGAAYVFKQNSGGADNWGLVKKITAADGAAGDLFGWSVSLDGKTLVLGAPLDNSANLDQGSAYIFKTENDAWVEDAKPLPTGCSVDDAFGYSVSISGDTAVVGTLAADVGANANQGTVYIFERNQGGPDTWGLVKTITSSDGAADDRFGTSVSVSANSVIVGAYRHAFGANQAQGAAYIFDRNQGGTNNWGEVKKLLASDGTAFDSFGLSVSISNDTALVGSYFHKVGANGLQGAAYVFERNAGGSNNWGESKILTASDGAVADEFGWSVAISNDTAVVGAINAKVGANFQQGKAHVFERNRGGANNWGEAKRLVASDGAAVDDFGIRVAISGNTVVVGAFFHDVSGKENQGSAYVYERDQGGASNWGETKHLISADGAAGDGFGFAVGISGDAIVVGANAHGVGANLSQGSAYVFGRNAGGANNWGLTQQLTASDGSAYDGFSVPAIDGDKIVVGAFHDDVNGTFNLGSAYVFVNQATVWTQQAHLLPTLPSNCGTSDAYGWSVAINGDTVVIGAWADDVGANQDQGSAYVLDRNQGGPNHWGVVKLLVASDGASYTEDNGLVYGDGFGISVAVEGDTIVVGAFQAKVETKRLQGAAYVFERNNGGSNNWGEVKKLTASDGIASSRFGGVVSIDNNTIIIGSVNFFDANAQGSAYLFERNLGGPDNWGEVRKLTASDGAAGDVFGGAVSISGDSAIVGAYAHDGPNPDQGAAYIFERSAGGQNGWGEVKKLTASDGELNDYFGHRVAISGDHLIVGAFSNNIGVNAEQGAAYIFERNAGGANNWGEVKRLIASDGEADDELGISVGISGDTALVGAYLDDVGQNVNQGSAYIFEQNKGGPDNWGQVQRVIAAEGSANDGFGYAVAISGDDLIIGANITQLPAPPGSNSLRTPSGVAAAEGAAYIFRGVGSAPTAANGTVSGHIASVSGNPLAGVSVRLSGTQNRLTVTDVQGNYRFNDVEANGFYTVTPSLPNLTFSPPERSFSQLGEHTEAGFTASSNGSVLNPLDATGYFVRRQYVDFLNREPDESGLNFWIDNIERCGSDQNCREVQRINTSAAFFLSIEFQQTGYLVYRTYQAAYGDIPNAPVPIRFSEFQPDTQEIGRNLIVNQPGWQQQLESNKQAYMAAFVQRSRFIAAYPATLSAEEFVDRLFANAGVTPSLSERAEVINEFGSATSSADIAARGRALRLVAENAVLQRQEFESAFVLMQYFGYLQRDPDSGPDADFSGYNFWLTKLRSFNGDYKSAEMVKAFLSSGEYRRRFGP